VASGRAPARRLALSGQHAWLSGTASAFKTGEVWQPQAV
jgi:hypothetical protein